MQKSGGRVWPLAQLPEDRKEWGRSDFAAKDIRKRRTEGMKQVLIVVDMQEDFIFGSLGSKEARSILPAVRKRIEAFRDRKSVV